MAAAAGADGAATTATSGGRGTAGASGARKAPVGVYDELVRVGLEGVNRHALRLEGGRPPDNGALDATGRRDVALDGDGTNAAGEMDALELERRIDRAWRHGECSLMVTRVSPRTLRAGELSGGLVAVLDDPDLDEVETPAADALAHLVRRWAADGWPDRPLAGLIRAMSEDCDADTAVATALGVADGGKKKAAAPFGAEGPPTVVTSLASLRSLVHPLGGWSGGGTGNLREEWQAVEERFPEFTLGPDNRTHVVRAASLIAGLEGQDENVCVVAIPRCAWLTADDAEPTDPIELDFALSASLLQLSVITD